MKKRKIDIVEKYFYPVTAGIEVNLLETYSVLAKKGWKVTAHTSLDTLTERNVLKKSDFHRGIDIGRYKFSVFGYKPNIDWDSADIVALHNFNVFPHFWIMVYTLLRKLTGHKNYSLVLTPHGGYNPEWSVFPFWQSSIKRIYHFTLGALMINLSVDTVRAVSEWEKYWMVKRFLNPDKIHVIPNGIEDEAFIDVDKKASSKIKKDVKSWGKYIIQIGRIYPIKNYETTIRALALLKDKKIKFVVVGPCHESDDYKHSLEKLAKELGVEERVVFTGVIKGIDKFYAIKHSITMVHMAIWESFCNVVHEALSQGLIPVVANNTALPFLIQNNKNGFLVNTHDHHEVSNKLEYIIENSNKSELKQMSRNNKSEVVENSWKNVAQNMHNLYFSLIK